MLNIKSIKLENFEHFAVTALIGLMLLNFSYYFFYEIFGNVLTGLSLILFFIFILTQIRDKKLKIIIFLILLLDILISLHTIDFSSDGVTYHSKAINLISEGKSLFPIHNLIDIRLETQPPLQWLMAGGLKSLFKESVNINSFGKLFLGVVLFSYCYFVLRKISARLKEEKLIFFSFLWAFPPIFFTQLFTGYSDYLAYFSLALLTLSTFKFYLLPNNNDLKIIFLSAAIALLVKYTSTFLVLIFSPFILFVLFKKYNFAIKSVKKNYFFFIISMIIFLICLSCIYLKNIFYYSHLVPIEKVLGAKNIWFDNVFYRSSNQLLHFIYSIFSRASLNTDQPSLNLFYFPTLKELYELGYSDTRFGASGPFFGLSLLLSIALCFYYSRIFFIPLILLLSVFIFLPGVGQLRYFPIVQALPLIFLIPALSLNRPYKQTSSINKHFSYFLIISFLNLSTLVVGSSSNYAYKFYSYMNFVSNLEFRDAMDIRFGSWDYYKFDLEKRNIIFIKNDQLNTKCESIQVYFHVALSEEINVCFPPDKN